MCTRGELRHSSSVRWTDDTRSVVRCSASARYCGGADTTAVRYEYVGHCASRYCGGADTTAVRYCWRSGHQQQDVDVEVYWYEELCAVSGVMQHVLCV